MTMNTRVHRNCCRSLLLLGLALAACSEEVRPPRSDEGRPIKILTVAQGAASMEREYLGATAASQEAELAFEVPGQIIEFPVLEGGRVAAGDLLARVDPANFVARSEAAGAQLAAAEADLKRKGALLEIGGVARVAFEEAERRVVAARSDVATTAKALRDTELRAPFDGVVGKILRDKFTNVRMKETVLILQDPTWMEVTVHVPEVDIGFSLPGLSLSERNERVNAIAVISALPGREFPATVSEFTTTADSVVRTYDVTFRFETPKDAAILGGMSARIRASRSTKVAELPGYLLPTAVVAGDSTKSPYVWIIGTDMRALKRSVTIGEISGSMIEILAGVEVGDRIALTGVHHLRDGLTVSEWEQK